MTISQRVKASQLEEVDLDTTDKPRPINVAKELPNEEKKAMVALLTDFRDVFAWSYEDLRGLDPQLYQHQLLTHPMLSLYLNHLLVIALAWTHIYLCARALGAVIPSRSGESVDFGFVSHIYNAHKCPSLLGISGCSLPPSPDQVPIETCDRVGYAISLGRSFQLRSRPLSELIAINGYKLLYLCLPPIFRFPRLIIHTDSLRVVLYLSLASISMETRLLFRLGTCRTRCRVSVFPFGNRMGTSPFPAILHSCPLPRRTVTMASSE